jgi:ATP-dependent Lhr-like helicase
VLYVERGGRGLLTLVDRPLLGAPGGGHAASGRPVAPVHLPGEPDPLHEALAALADAVRAGRVGKLSLERIDGEPAIASSLAETLVELGFHTGPRRMTLTA